MAETTKEREDRLVRSNMGLVVKIVKGFNPKDSNEYDEYVQVGSIGLLKAIRKHKPDLGALSTIAYPYIYYSVLRSFKQNQKNRHEVLFEDACHSRPHTPLWELIPANLTDIEKQIVSLRIEHGLTFEEIGKRIGGYTRGWANKLYKLALKKIQQANE